MCSERARQLILTVVVVFVLLFLFVFNSAIE